MDFLDFVARDSFSGIKSRNVPQCNWFSDHHQQRGSLLGPGNPSVNPENNEKKTEL